VITNTDDFSASDRTLSGYVETADIVGTHPILSQGSASAGNFLRLSSNEWRTSIGAGHTFTAISPTLGAKYYFELFHDVSENEVTLTTRNLETDIEVSETVSLTMVSNTNDFWVGRWQSFYAEQSIYGLKLDHANGFEIPVSDKTGDISYDVSGNAKDCTWQESPERVDQDSYFWNEAEGYSAIWDVTSATDAAVGPEVVGAPIEAGVDISMDVKISTAETEGALFGKGDATANLLLIWSQASSSTSLFDGGATITVDGTTLTGTTTRGELYSLIATNDWLTIDIVGADLSGFSTGLFLSGYTSALWDGQVRNLVINDVPFDGPLKVPALAAGTNDANGYPLTNPAGPWLYEGDETYVDFDVVPNANQWLEQRWIDASFDGVTSRLDIGNTGTTIFQFDDVWEWKALLFTSALGIQGITTVGNATEGFNLTGGTSIQTHFGAGYVSVGVGYTRGEENDLTVSMDGSGTSLTLSNINATNGLTENTRIAAFTQIGEPTVSMGLNGGNWWDGEMRSLKYTHEGTVYFDTPLLGCSLDLSSEVNHGTDTNIVYNRLTDTSYTAGDVVEQPFSVNDDTSGRVSELIQFTFPVTTLSSTPTISQTVFEDGNTVTQDGILISES
jgi:hypothetical protein